ncbi:MAG: rhomboid family intramembrane serine protease [Hyphomicrobium sp.]
MRSREPVFNVPGAVTAILAALIVVHLGRQVISPESDNWFVALMAFIPWRYDGGAAELPGGTGAVFTSLLSHMFVHGDFVHLTFNCAWLLAFGGAIAKRIGAVRFFAFAAWTGVAGALTFLAFNFGLMAPVIGASGAISGMMGGTMRFLFSALDDGGIAQLRDNPRSVQLMTLAQAFSDRRVQFATATWLLVNLLAVYGVGTGGAAGSIAWEAHIGGFLAGLLTFGWFDLAIAKQNQSQPTFH